MNVYALGADGANLFAGTFGGVFVSGDNGDKSPGHYQAVFDGSRLPSGAYFYKLVAGELCLDEENVVGQMMVVYGGGVA